MTLKEIIYDLREKLKINSDDIDISNEYLAHLIGVKRALLLKQRYSKFSKTVPSETTQTICVDLEEVNSINGENCFGTILKSKNKIPTLIQLDNLPSILDVRIQDLLSLPLNIIDIERFPYVLSSKWTANQIYVAITDGYLYFTSGAISHKFLESVRVSGIFFNPEDADTYSCDTNTGVDCDFYDKEYPVEAHMVHDIVNMIFKELAPGIKLTDDKLNNADESPR